MSAHGNGSSRHTDGDVTEHRLTLADGRVVAWTEHGPRDGAALVRFPGTPGSRWSLGGGDLDRFHRRGLRVITTERPGFGVSTRLARHGFVEPADDVARIVDHLGIDAAFVTGGSGGAPYVLAFLARHGDRARAATIEVGAAPTSAADAATMVEINRLAWELAHRGDWDAMRAALLPIWESMVADPIGGLRGAVADATEDDLGAMDAEDWQAAMAKGIHEAIRLGPDGWVDEAMAMETRWDEIDLDAIATSVTWWHSRTDVMSPYTSVERLVAGLPNARLLELTDQAHMGIAMDDARLDELLARGSALGDQTA